MKYTTKILATIILLIPIFVVAQDNSDRTLDRSTTGTPSPSFKITIPNPLKIRGCDNVNSTDCGLPKLIEVIIKDLVTPIAAIVVVLMIMYAGFLYVTAQGDKAQITKARDTLLYGAIGAGILLGANIIATAIQTTIKQLG